MGRRETRMGRREARMGRKETGMLWPSQCVWDLNLLQNSF